MQAQLGVNIDVPSWLMDEQPTARRTSRELRLLTDETYSAFFETLLDEIAEGKTLSSVVKADNRGFEAGKIRQWIWKDATRKARYYEAKAMGAEAFEDEVIDISDGTDNPLEDVQRSTLRIATRKWRMGVSDRNRYSETRKLEVTSKNEEVQVDKLELLANRLVALQKGPDQVYDVDAVDVTDKMEILDEQQDQAGENPEETPVEDSD